MKYISADKLLSEIEKILSRADKEEKQAFLKKDGNRHIAAVTKTAVCAKIKKLIASLQQEHSEGLHFTPLNRLIQKIPPENWNDTVNNYAKKLRDCLIKEGYRKDAEVLQGYISYMNGNNVPMATMDEQEQPEAVFEKEEFVSVAESPLKTFPRVNDFECGSSYRH